jgi:hypothetical protein
MTREGADKEPGAIMRGDVDSFVVQERQATIFAPPRPAAVSDLQYADAPRLDVTRIVLGSHMEHGLSMDQIS